MKSMPYLESCVLQHFGSTQAFINYAFSIWLQDYCVTVSPNFTVTSCSDFTWISTAFFFSNLHNWKAKYSADVMSCSR